MSPKKKSQSNLPDSVRNRFSSIIKWTVKSGQNVCIFGAAGTGKSELLRRIHQASKEKKKNINVATFTGQAAEQFRNLSMNAQTVHKVLYQIDIIKTDIMIIDDFSIINEELFESLNESCQKKRRIFHKPFGGIQLIIAGDPYSLLPIDGRPCFKSSLWQDCNFRYYKLSYPLRYGGAKVNSKGQQWFDMLKRIRRGAGTSDDLEIILDTCNDPMFRNFYSIDCMAEHLDESVQAYRKREISKMPKFMFGKIASVKKYNLQQLDRIDEPITVLRALDWWSPQRCPHHVVVQKLDSEIDAKLVIKMMAPVVVTRNTGQILNGTSGILVGGDKKNGYLHIRVKNGDIIALPRYAFKANFIWNGMNIEAERHQYAISLAFATTVHKALGSEYNEAVTYIDDLWAPGQFYTALSRCNSPRNTFIASNDKRLTLKKINNYSRWGNEFKSIMKESKKN